MEQRLLDEEERKALRVYQEYKRLSNIIEKTQAIDDDSVLPKDLQNGDKQNKMREIERRAKQKSRKNRSMPGLYNR